MRRVELSRQRPIRRAMWAALLLPTIVYAYGVCRFNWLVDDAFITFRYSKHLVQGFGLRFNVGESPPVEGFSNLLWVLMLAPFEAIGGAAPVASRVMTVVSGVVLAWRMVRFLRVGCGLPIILVFLSILSFAALPSVAVWSTSGLETMPFCLLVFLAFECLLGDPRAPRGVAGGIMCSLLALMRVDGMIWGVVVLGLAAFKAFRDQNRSHLHQLFVCAAILAVHLIILATFRICYFGYPVPNTVLVKVGLCAMTLGRGIHYALSYLLTFPHVAGILVVTGVRLVRGMAAGDVEREAFVLAVFGFCYAATAGGDWMPMGRLLLPTLPFVTILLAMMLERAQGGIGVAVLSGACVVLSVLPGFDVHIVPNSVRDRFEFRYSAPAPFTEYEQWSDERRLTSLRVAMAQTLSRSIRAGESFTAGAVGIVAYYTDAHVFDTTGLVNLEVARREGPRRRMSPGHDKSVGPDFFLKYSPTCYWIQAFDLPEGTRPALHPGRWVRLRAADDSFRKWLNTPEAIASYEPIGTLLPDGTGSGRQGPSLLVMYVRKAVLQNEGRARFGLGTPASSGG